MNCVVHWIVNEYRVVKIVPLIFFTTKYTATHEQVTRSAPPSNPTTKRYLTLTPREQKISMSWHSLLRKETN